MPLHKPGIKCHLRRNCVNSTCAAGKTLYCMAVSHVSDDGADIVIPAGISAVTSGTNWRTMSSLRELDGTTGKVAGYSGTFALTTACPYVTPRR